MNVRNSEKIQDKCLLFQRFVTSIVALLPALKGYRGWLLVKTEFVNTMNEYFSFNVFSFVSGYISCGSKEPQANILADRDWRTKQNRGVLPNFYYPYVAGLLRLMGPYLGQKRGTELSS